MDKAWANVLHAFWNIDDDVIVVFLADERAADEGGRKRIKFEAEDVPGRTPEVPDGARFTAR